MRHSIDWIHTMLRHPSKMGTLGRGLIVILTMAFAATQYAMAAEESDTTRAYLAEWLKQPTLTFDTTTIGTEPMRHVYSLVGYQPLWVDSEGLTSRATKALDVIAKAGEQGLNADIYAVQSIRSIDSMPRGNADQSMRRRLSLELLMSHAVMRYATDMHTGAVRHQWNTGAEALSAADQTVILTQAASTLDTAGYLSKLAPDSAQYNGLRKALGHYQAIAANGGWPAFTPGKTLKPGMSDPRVATLRDILYTNGDMAATSASPVYDTATVEGVKKFQDRHGIEADGVLGAGTQAALAVPVSKRMEQIAMTMERMRWMPRDLGNRYVLVNIPSYELTAVAGAKEMHMDVIVGKTATPTPMFSKEITNVTFNPSWSVPGKIAINEMLPKIRKNPNYLTNAGYTIVSSGGGEVEPSSINWDSVGHGNFNYTLRQNPGDGNALGKVKFTIPDSDNIYLHDTSNHGAFARSERNLSHGCVRLSDPKALTTFVLQSEGWSEAKIDASYDSDASKTVRITPMPVHLVYWTSWVDSAGRTHFTRDIYGKDKSLLAAMSLPGKHGDSIKLAMN